MKASLNIARTQRSIESATPVGLEINVLFTDVASTLRALRSAGELAKRLHAHLKLIVPQIVSYACPLDQPPVAPEFLGRRLGLVAGTAHLPLNVQVLLCRDREQALQNHLPPHSILVLGSRTRWWWFDPDRKLVNQLRREGHEVLTISRSQEKCSTSSSSSLVACS